jgi:hypothetical protein
MQPRSFNFRSYCYNEYTAFPKSVKSLFGDCLIFSAKSEEGAKKNFSGEFSHIFQKPSWMPDKYLVIIAPFKQISLDKSKSLIMI